METNKMENNIDHHQTLMVETLQLIPLFSSLTINQLISISLFCHPLLLNDGDIIISENDNVNYDLFSLLNGQVEVLSKEKNSDKTEIVISKEYKVILGEISWLSHGARTATVRCVGDVELIRIDGQQLMEYLNDTPDAGFKVMQHISLLLAQRLISTDTLLKQLLWNIDI